MVPDLSKIVPTDNLYKFLALMGLLVAVAGFYLTELFRMHIGEQLNTQVADVEELVIQYENLLLTVLTVDQVEEARESTKLDWVNLIKRLVDDSDDSILEIIDAHAVMDDRLRFLSNAFKASEFFGNEKTRKHILEHVKPNELDAIIREASKKMDDKELIAKFTNECAVLREKNARLRSKWFGIIRLENSRERLNFWSPIIIWGGAILSALGFGLWWFKVQRYQDHVLRAQLKDN